MTHLDAIIRAVARDLGMPSTIVEKVYKAYWRAMRDHITSIPMKEELTDDEFLSYRPNVNIPSIGKLYVTLDRYKRMKELYKIRKEQRDAAHQKG